MGQREDMLLALGIDPTMTPADPRTIAPPAGPPGLVDTLTQDARARAEKFGQILQGTADVAARPLAPLRPYGEGIGIGTDIVNGITNPIGTAIGVGSTLANNPGMATRAGTAVLSLDRPREGVTTRNRDAEPATLSPMTATSAAPVIPAPTLASMGSPAASPGVTGGGGGGGFGGLERNVRDAQGRQLAGYDTAADLERQLGVEGAGRANAVGDMREQGAMRMQRDAEDQQRIDALAAQKHEEFLARQETLANDLAKQQIDPGRLIRNADTGTQIMMGLGAALGGVFGNGRNDYLDRLDKLVERDINAQIQDIDSKKASFSARQSLFGQMLAETGDRRLAAMQTRTLIYDAMDRKLKADAERLGIPEMRTNAEIKATEIQQRKQVLDVQIQQALLQQARASAAAQVAAQRAAEDRLRQHTIEMIKLQQEQQKIDRMGGGADKSDEGARHIAGLLQTAGVPQARTAAEEALAALQKSPGGKADAFARGVLGGASNAVMSEDSNAREQKYQAYVNAAMKAMLGNVTESELARAEKQFGAANDPAARERAIRSSLATLEAIERNAKAGESPEAQQKYEARRAAAAGNRAPAFVPDPQPANPWLKGGK